MKSEKDLIADVKKGGIPGNQAFQELLARYKKAGKAVVNRAYSCNRRFDMTREDFEQLLSLSLYKVCLSVDLNRIDDNFSVWPFWSRRFKTYLISTYEEQHEDYQDIQTTDRSYAWIDFFESLTPIQRRIVEMARSGMTKKQIRASMKVSWNTLNRHLNQIAALI